MDRRAHRHALLQPNDLGRVPILVSWRAADHLSQVPQFPWQFGRAFESEGNGKGGKKVK